MLYSFVHFTKMDIFPLSKGEHLTSSENWKQNELKAHKTENKIVFTTSAFSNLRKNNNNFKSFFYIALLDLYSHLSGFK